MHGEGRKLNKLVWEKVCQWKKKKGGLGFGPLEDKNDALLGKWWWRFNTEKNALWKAIVCANYNWDLAGPLHESNRIGRATSKIWKDIMPVGTYW